MKLFGYLRSVMGSGTGDSAKSFSLVMSTLTGVIMGLTVCFILIWDVVHNNQLLTDLEKLGLFVVCVGVYITGSGVPKIFGEKYSGILKKDEEINIREEERSGD